MTAPLSPACRTTTVQVVDVPGFAGAIDGGGAAARARAWVAETMNGADHGRVALVFLAADDGVLGDEEPAYGELTPLTWTEVEAAAAIRAGTRKIKVCLDARRDSLPSSVAFDDLSLAINPGDLTELSVAVYQISAQVGRGFPSKATVHVS